MREYIIEFVTGQPDWNTIPKLPIDTVLWTEPAPIRAWAQICRGDDRLHIRLSAEEPHIRAENREMLQEPCEDSCLEFFFCPDPADSRYFNIEFNPNGLMYLGFGSGIHDLIRLMPVDKPITPQIDRTENGWILTYSVPYHLIRRFFPNFHPVSGSCIRANCYKCGDLTVHPHFLSWNPVTSEKPAFHRPQDFGLMRFA